MKQKLKKLFYRLAYLDSTGEGKKEDTYFFRFTREICQSNLRMMQSMSIFIIIISLFVIASSFTYFGTKSLLSIYMLIFILEIVILGLIQLFLKKDFSPKVCTLLTSLHLIHMLALSSYIGVIYCQDESAITFIVILTISSMVFTLPTMLTMSISSALTIITIIASYYIKESYWFESDVLNGISVLLFSFLLGWKINHIRSEEAFSRADALRLNTELKKISVTDPLTGLHNHRSFQDSYYELFRTAHTKQLPLGVIMIDLDNFKSFNDNYGHVEGDYCLSKVANAISDSVPTGAIVCRYGGEEFIVLLDEFLCYEAGAIGEDIRKAVVALEIPHSHTISDAKVVTLSLGAYVGVPVKNEKPMSFVERADKAMYHSKDGGRNRLTITFG